MLIRLLLLFMLVPLVELAVLIEVGRRMGTWWTICLVVGTGAVGAALARSQGLRTVQRLRSTLAAGRFPGDELLHGVLILAGGLLLLTPGLLTDIAGFVALIPVSRRLLTRALGRAVAQYLARHRQGDNPEVG